MYEFHKTWLENANVYERMSGQKCILVVEEGGFMHNRAPLLIANDVPSQPSQL